MIEETTGRLDFGALRDAIERRDPDALLGFYAEEEELRIVHEALPDGKVFELKGSEQIERYLRTICDQEMDCSVEGGAIYGERGIAFVEACRYPDGGAVSVETMLEVAGGLIVGQTDVVGRAPSDGTEGGEG